MFSYWRYCFVSRTCNKSSPKAIYTSIASYDFSVAIEIQLDKACPGSEVLPRVYLPYTELLFERVSWRKVSTHGINRTSVSIEGDEGA